MAVLAQFTARYAAGLPQFVSAYYDDAAAGISVSDAFSGGNVDDAASTIDATVPTEPVLHLRFHPTADTTFGLYGAHKAASITGVVGIRPKIRFYKWTGNDRGLSNYIFVSSQPDGPYTAIQATASGADYYEFQPAQAFDQDTVYVFSHRPATTGAVADWVGQQLAAKPELVTNGDFSNLFVGWEAVAPWSVSEQQTAVMGSTSAWLPLQQFVAMLAGVKYRVTVDLIAVSGPGLKIMAYKDGTVVDVISEALITAGRHTLVYEPPSDIDQIKIVLMTVGEVSSGEIDNVSITEVSTVHRLQSDLAYTDDPTVGVVASTAACATWWGKQIPPLPIYGFRIADDSVVPAGGKRRGVLLGGQHSSEPEGVRYLRGFVDWLLSADAAAVTMREEWEWFVFPMTNPTGHFGGGARCSFEGHTGSAGDPGQDANRDWDVAASVLPSVQAIKDALALDIPSARINAFLDCHGNGSTAQTSLYTTAGGNDQGVIDLAAAMDARADTLGVGSYVSASIATYAGASADRWASPGAAQYGYPTQCEVGATPEIQTYVHLTDATLGLMAQSLALGLADRYAAGDYAPLELIADEASGMADADSAALTLAHVAVGDDATAAAGSDTGAVSSSNEIAGSDAAGQADADSADVAQLHTLAGSDAEAGAAADSGATDGTVDTAGSDSAAAAAADSGAVGIDAAVHDLASTDSEARSEIDTGAASAGAVVHQPVAADAEGQAAMDSAAVTQLQTLAGNDAAAVGDITDAALRGDGIGAVFCTALIDVTVTTYLIDPATCTGASA